MSSKKEVEFAYSLAVILFIVGVVSFSAFPAKAPGEPVRIMFKSLAGKVFLTIKHTFQKKVMLFRAATAIITLKEMILPFVPAVTAISILKTAHQHRKPVLSVMNPKILKALN